MRVFDTLMNLVTGIGTAKDKSVGLQHVFAPLDRTQIDAAYRGDWVARKIIDIPPYDEVRSGRDWQAENDQIELIEAEEKRLGLWPKVLKARRLARLYGGSAIYIGATDAAPELPLIPDRVKRGGVLYLHVLSRFDLSPTEIDRDVTSAFFGEPEFWQVRGKDGQAATIHPSRIVRFVGAPVPDETTVHEPYWGDSILESVMDAVRNLGLAHQGVAALLNEAKLDIFRIPNLMEGLSDERYEARLRTRLLLANTMKSQVNALVMDKEEEYEQKQISFATLPDVMDRYMQAAAGAADIPATRMLGQSPSGMNATGDGDYKNYLDRISAGQELDLRPRLEPLDECIIRSALGSRPKEVHYTWSPLWRMSEKDMAEVAYKKAQAFQIDANSGLLPDSALAKGRVNQLVEDGTYPGLEAAMGEAEAEGDAIDFGEKAEQAKAANDNPVPPEEEQLRASRAGGRRFGDIASFVTDAEPRTLYVSRKVVNAANIIAWAKAQGFETTLPADDLHVTVCYSRTPLDWMKIEPDWGSDEKGQIIVAPGGPRLMEKFGDAVVLLFSHWKLMSRHGEFMRAGASHDFDDYQPHVTITYELGDVDLDKVQPYQGKIVLGPEIFAEVKEDWQAETEGA